LNQKDLSPTADISNSFFTFATMIDRKNIKKVLIIRFSSIGDIVLTSPVSRLLKAKGYEVHYLSKKSFKGLLETNKNIDKVFCIDSQVSEIIEELKNECYDFVADLHWNIRSKQVLKALNVPFKKLDKLNLNKLMLVWFKWNIMPKGSVVERYIDVVSDLGIENDNKGLDYFIPKGVEVNWREDFEVERFISFVIGGQHEGKMMSPTKIKEVCLALPLPVVLLGGPDDMEKGEWIEAHGEGKIINAAGKYSLNESSYLLDQSACVISHDTGLMHIASALNKPVVSLWGGTVPELGFAPYMPGRRSEEIGVKHFMRPSSKLGRRKGVYRLFNFMDAIPVEKIVAAVNLAI